MAGRLQREIKQSKPFRNLRAEAYLNLLKTADVLEQATAAALKPYGISGTQYNVLRILRGAGPDGLRCSEIGSRMITRDPDITRLLDRMETRKLVVRQREEKDRRVVLTRITEAGLELLRELQQPLETLLETKLGHIGIQKLRSLIELLELARAS
jgi:MarR family transcriptional regulator, organic hydroperoxide resistance regulator